MVWRGTEWGWPAHICRFRPVVFSLGPSQGKRVLKNTDIAPFFSPPRHPDLWPPLPPGGVGGSLTKERAATTHPPVAAVTMILLSQLK